MSTMSRVAAAGVLAAVLAAPAAAQGETEVIAGARYRAGSTHRAVLGEGYRDAWTAPIRVPVLDLGSFAGGLTPTERGGGNQTRSLRLRGADGREYAFRSVDKNPTRTLGPDVEGTLVGGVLQDLVSAQHPSGQLSVDVLEEALGILHAPRRLYVMPDDPRLGEFRAEFAGMLGYLEERPDEGSTGTPGLARAADVEGTEDFLEKLQENARQRLDERDYLTVRLLDLLIGDWDRHHDQYRWARFDHEGGSVWRPIPRDRDYAFVNYAGLGPTLARRLYAKAVRFGPDPGTDLYGLFQNSQQMDRRLLGELDRTAWEEVTASVVARVDDAVIERAIARLPEGHRAPTGEVLLERLRTRRAHLPAASARLYGWLAVEPEVHARDAADFAVAERMADGSLEVRLYSAPAEARPYFRRRYVPEETREVRIFLLGGNDRAVVRGAGPGRIGVRVVGGPGDDVLADSSSRGDTRFYDHEGENRFVTRRGTRVDRRTYEAPEWKRGRGSTPPREWGRDVSFLTPLVDWRSRMGPVIGAGPSWTDYGFRRYPLEDRGHLAVVYAPDPGRVGVEYRGTYHFTGDRRWLGVDARATGLSAADFRGFGNQTPRLTRDEYRVFERRLVLEPTWHFPLSRRGWLRVGPTLEWRDPEPGAQAVARLTAAPGWEEWGAAGLRAGVDVDRRDALAFPRLGWSLRVAGDAFPAVHALDGPFGGADAVATGYLSAGAGPVLALRAGGRLAWGDFPLQHAAFLGGSGSLRGHIGDRFAGDAAAFGSAELRQPLFRANLLVRGTLGALGLADAGRVWLDGNSEGDWHTAVGGGLYFNFLEGSRSVSLYMARGEVTRIYAHLGLPF